MSSINFFSDLADKLAQDSIVMDYIEAAENLSEIYLILKRYKYIDLELEDYLLTALEASDEMKNFLDPDTGELSGEVLKA